MKNLILSSIMILLLSGISCKGKTEKSENISLTSGNDVEVFYFHLNTRCVTCQAVEAEARKNIEMLYPELFNAGKISFIALNLEEASGKSIGERLGVSGQTLLIVKGDQKINLTTEGFLYAVAKPEKFKEIMKEKVDPLVKE